VTLPGGRTAARFLAAAFLVPFAAPASAAQNKVRADPFLWRVAATPHFDIHVTPEGESVLPRVAEILEEAYARVTADLGVPVPGRTPVFLYPTHNRFEQSNVADAGEGTGGVTEAFKNRLLITHDGTDAWLRHVLPHEFTHVVEFEALYGGFWKSARLLKSPFYPLWFMEGLSEHESGDVDRAEEDMVLRDAATRGLLYPLTELHGFNHLKPHQITLAYKQGGAAVRFLAEEYGRAAPGEFLKMMRDRFDQNSILLDLTGQDFRSFDARFREHLADVYAAQSEDLEEPEAYGERITLPDSLPAFHTSPALSPDGRFLAYVTDRDGPRTVVLRNLSTGEERAVAGGDRSRLDTLEGANRSLAFSPDGRRLAFIGEKNQRDYLFLYDVRRRRLRRVRTPLAEVRSPAFHPDGARIAVSGREGGTRKLFEISPGGRVIKRITDGTTDADHPAYAPDGKTLVFSWEAPARGDAPPERELVALDLATGERLARTSLPGRETEPVYGPDGRSVFFVGEGTAAVRDLYRWDPLSGAVVRLTRAIGGNFSPAFSRDGKASVFVSYRGTSMGLYRARPDLWTSGLPVLASTGPAAVGDSPVGEAVAKIPPVPRPYRMRASTDLFFPVLYYSSDGGLFAAALWQASEMLGNHDLRTTFQYASGDRLLDYQAEYGYRRFRPDLFVSAAGQSFYSDVRRTQREREDLRVGGARYPLDRFHRLEGEASFLRRGLTFQDAPSRNSEERENTFSVALVRDTSEGRYLGVTSGSRLRLSTRWTPGVLGGDRRYRTHDIDHQLFVPVGGESALAFRTRTGVSVGESPERLRLGGADRLRGYSRRGDENRASRYALLNVEWRTPLVYWRRANLPALAGMSFKGLYGTLFSDLGLDWRNAKDLRDTRWSDARNSVGGGFGFPAFVFQTFPLWLDVQIARRTDAREWTLYFTLGPSF